MILGPPNVIIMADMVIMANMDIIANLSIMATLASNLKICNLRAIFILHDILKINFEIYMWNIPVATSQMATKILW